MKPLLLFFLATAALVAQSISGTYVGAAKTEMPDGVREASFTIVVKEDGEKLLVTGAPTGTSQLPAKKLGRSGNLLKFEITPPYRGEEPVKFDVSVKNGKLTGKMITTKGRLIIPGTLELYRKLDLSGK